MLGTPKIVVSRIGVDRRTGQLVDMSMDTSRSKMQKLVKAIRSTSGGDIPHGLNYSPQYLSMVELQTSPRIIGNLSSTFGTGLKGSSTSTVDETNVNILKPSNGDEQMFDYNEFYALSSGDYVWGVPEGVTSVTVKLWGAGGSGGGTNVNSTSKGGGGAGGQFAQKVVAVTPFTSHNIHIGSAGSTGVGNGGAGQDSTFDSTVVVAKGGAGGQRAVDGGAGGVGSTTGGVGDIVNKGGNGSNGGATSTGGSGGGGGGSAGNGVNASGNSGGTGGGGDSGSWGTYGGDGANGRTTVGNGNSPVDVGGGGGSAYTTDSTDRSGGGGGVGGAMLTWVDPTNPAVWCYLILNPVGIPEGELPALTKRFPKIVVGTSESGMDYEREIHSFYDNFKVMATGTLSIHKDAHTYSHGDVGTTSRFDIYGNRLIEEVTYATFEHNLGYCPMFAPFVNFEYMLEATNQMNGQWYDQGDWVTATQYVANQVVRNPEKGDTYRCILSHISASGNKPDTGGTWATYWELVFDEFPLWVTATSYSVGQKVAVLDSGFFYEFNCISAHTSGASTKPDTGVDWETKWEYYDQPAVTSQSLVLNDVEDLKIVFGGAEVFNFTLVEYYVTETELVLKLTRTTYDWEYLGFPPNDTLLETDISVNYTVFYNRADEEFDLLN